MDMTKREGHEKVDREKRPLDSHPAPVPICGCSTVVLQLVVKRRGRVLAADEHWRLACVTVSIPSTRFTCDATQRKVHCVVFRGRSAGVNWALPSMMVSSGLPSSCCRRSP